MGKRYKLIISNKRIYREVELMEESAQLMIGTVKGCDVRFRKEQFFEDISVKLERVEDRWYISCSERLYISADGVMKLISKELFHGDEVYIKYQKSNQEVFKLSFMVDFDFEKKKYDRVIYLDGKSNITIGGKIGNDIVLNDELIGSDQVALTSKEGRWYIEDQNTRYGVYVNGIRIKEKQEIREYDFFSVIGYSFYVKDQRFYTSQSSNIIFNGVTYRDISEQKSHMEYPKFNRSARVQYTISEEPISILDPAAIPEKPKNNLIMSLIPTVIMLILTIVIRGSMGGGGTFVIFSACTMGIGILTSIINYRNGKKGYKKAVKDRIDQYTEYARKKEEQILEARKKEKDILEKIYYSVEEEEEIVEGFYGNLFERKEGDWDYLHVRIGSGIQAAKREIEYKKQEKLELSDELGLIPEKLAEKYKYIENVPIVCNFMEMDAVGVIGSIRHRYAILKTILMDLCIRHFEDDVKIFLLLSEEHAQIAQKVRFLPHLQNQELNIRNIVCDDDSKVSLMEYLYKELTNRESAKKEWPRFVILVFDSLDIRRHPVSRYLDQAKKLGVTFVFFEEYRELLPKSCNSIINVISETEGELLECGDAGKKTRFHYQEVSDEKIEKLSIKLGAIYSEQVSLESSLTKNISLFDLLNILSVEDLDLQQRWQNAVIYKSMAAPLGVKTKNEIVYLDLHEKFHGPHGLVAGTTGSGKSEILQTYILSMATLFHPYEVGFVIIDFKGGGMVNQFRMLPHLVGAITNIDGKEINRSLKSIKAELLKRQELFAKADVNHIDAYIKKFKNGECRDPLPHLIVIVDEFAELKAEQPEFMKELISAARIGRSLGVHLILATQKPAGQVNEQIWSNSKFKLCLKVQTKEDSNEVIKSPLAAEIKEPGRAYLQVGNNEIFELFQSAYSGSPASMDVSGQMNEFYIDKVNLSGKREPIFQQKNNGKGAGSETQLKAIVQYIKGFCDRMKIPKLPDICLPPLKTRILLEENISQGEESISVAVGIYDDPDHQYQGQALLDIGAGNTMIIGSTQYGKTTMLQNIIRGLAEKHSPEEVNIYIIDFASMVLKNFESLSHVGGVVSSSEDEKLKNLFKLLLGEIKERKEKMVSVGVSSFGAYREAGYRDIPQIVLLIDNLTALKELYLQDNDVLLNISREGVAVGISIIAANSQTSGFGYRYLANFANRIALYCNDSNEYNNLFEFCRMAPENTAGRCLIEINRHIYECQAYLPFEGEKEIERVLEIKQFIQAQNDIYGDSRVKNIPVIPKVLTDRYVEKEFSRLQKGYRMVAGLDYSDVSPMAFDLSTLGMLAIVGKEQSGKGNFVRNLIYGLEKYGSRAEIIIVDDISRKFSKLQECSMVIQYTLAAEEIISIMAAWQQELEKRYQLMIDGNENELEEAPLLLAVIQNIDAITSISLNKAAMDAFRLMMTKYKDLKICFLFPSIPNGAIAYNSPEVLRMLKEKKQFLIFDDLSNIKVVDIPLAATREFKKPIELGDAYYIKENDIKKIKTVLHVET